MEDRIYHLIEIAAQVFGFGYIIFKGGRWIGESSGMFKTLFTAQAEARDVMVSHQREDDEKHEKVMETLTKVRVSIAGMGKQ